MKTAFTLDDFVELRGQEFEHIEVDELERIVSDINTLLRMEPPWAQYALEQFQVFFDRRAGRRHREEQAAKQPQQHGPSRARLQVLEMLRAAGIGRPYEELREAWRGLAPTTEETSAMKRSTAVG